jgi:hypothetical protein
MFDPDDQAISRFCEAQTFVTVHNTARHYLLSIQSTSRLSISRSPNLISSPSYTCFFQIAYFVCSTFQNTTCLYDRCTSVIML